MNAHVPVQQMSDHDYFLVELRGVSNHLRTLTSDVDAIGLAVKQGRMDLAGALQNLQDIGCLHLLYWSGGRI